MSDIKALIAKQREVLSAAKVETFDVVVGGERVTVGIEKILPDEWELLVASNPPRAGVEGDAMVGYNPKDVARSYPRVRVDDEVLDAETWADLYTVLDSTWRNNVEVVIWGLNVNEALRELAALGKPRAGQK